MVNSIPALVETERLLLRPYIPADAARVLDLQSRLDVIKWLDNPPFVPMETLEQAAGWIEHHNQAETDILGQAWRAIEVRESALVVGGVSVAALDRIDGGHIGEFELGWRLNPDSLGNGYATEAAQALADAAFDAGHEKLVIGMYTDNEPSAAVARRLGAKELGELDDVWYGGTSLQFELRPLATR